MLGSHNKEGIGTWRLLAGVPLEDRRTVVFHGVGWLLATLTLENLLVDTASVAGELVAELGIEVMAPNLPFAVVAFLNVFVLFRSLRIQLCTLVIVVYLVLDLGWIALERIDNDHKSCKEGKPHFKFKKRKFIVNLIL